jgi:dethiobiotin synthetase
MSRTLFVTGTGTDVGKTVLSLAVLLWARERGIRAGYLKPVQCGSRGPASSPPFGDADWIQALFPEARPSDAVYTFPDACSPHLAAERAGAWIDPDWIGEQAERAAHSVELLVIEGSGGAAVPLDREGTSLADLAALQGWPCLVAAAPGLGTLHHTIATAHFIVERGAHVAGFAFVEASPEPSPLHDDNVATLEALLGVPRFGTVPHVPGLDRSLSLSATAAARLAESLPGLDAWWKDV